MCQTLPCRSTFYYNIDGIYYDNIIMYYSSRPAPLQERKGLVSCLYASCTATARSAAQSDRLRHLKYGGAIPNALADQPGNLLMLAPAHTLINQLLDLHECRFAHSA